MDTHFFFKPSTSAASSSNISSSEAGDDEEIEISLCKRVKLSYNMPAQPKKSHTLSSIGKFGKKTTLGYSNAFFYLTNLCLYKHCILMH